MIKLSDIDQAHVVWTACRYIAKNPGTSKVELVYHLAGVYKHGAQNNFNWIASPSAMICSKNQALYVDQRGAGIFEWQKGRVNGRRQGYYILPLGEQFAQESEPHFKFVRANPMPTAWLDSYSEGMLLTSRRRAGGVFLYDPRNFTKMTYLAPKEIVTLVKVDEVRHLNDEPTHRKYGRDYITAKVTILHPLKGLFEVDPSCIKPLVKGR